jgi:hypothetical protein
MCVDATDPTARRVSALADLLTVSGNPRQSQYLKFVA